MVICFILSIYPLINLCDYNLNNNETFILINNFYNLI